MEVIVGDEDAGTATANFHEQKMEDSEVKTAFMPIACTAACGKYQLEDLILICTFSVEVRDICMWGWL